MQNKYLKNLVITSLTIVAAGISSGCAKQEFAASRAVPEAAKNLTGTLGCANLKSRVFDSFYELLDTAHQIPSSEDLKGALREKLKELTDNRGQSSKSVLIDQLGLELEDLVDLMFQEMKSNPDMKWNEMLQKLIEYEMEDTSEESIIQASESIHNQMSRVQALSSELDLPCESKPEVSAAPMSATTMSIGLNMVFATAYQSCSSLDLPAMTAATPQVAGVSRVGSHSDGVGGARAISNLSSVQNSHYYIKGQSYSPGCFNLRNKPLIYDYGGSPKVFGNTLDFFVNAGSGTSVLGVDCSAFVSSAIAVGGLRYKPALANKPIYVRQTSSKFINAAKSGFSCFENVKVNKSSSIKPGDVVGVNGHVVAIDRVGDDPFGIKNMDSESQCSELDYKKFDITVSQSSPSKNGIGINKYQVRDYLSESGKMRTAFVEMGKLACKAYFQNKTMGSSSSAWGFLRHKGTPECLAPRVTLAGESCTQKCIQ